MPARLPPAGEWLARTVTIGVPAALLGGAYVAQYVFGLAPCEMCWWQRYALFAALALGLAAVAVNARMVLVLAGLALAVSSAIGGFHAGVEYGWWEGMTACTVATAADAGGSALDAILGAKVIRCDVAPWSLAGVSLAGWNFLFSGAGALAILLALRPSARARRELAT